MEDKIENFKRIRREIGFDMIMSKELNLKDILNIGLTKEQKRVLNERALCAFKKAYELHNLN